MYNARHDFRLFSFNTICWWDVKPEFTFYSLFSYLCRYSVYILSITCRGLDVEFDISVPDHNAVVLTLKKIAIV